MRSALRQGRVLWYDAARGYGFVSASNDDDTDAIFITKSALDAFGITGLHKGLEIVFDVAKGQYSERVHSIVQLKGAHRIH